MKLFYGSGVFCAAVILIGGVAFGGWALPAKKGAVAVVTAQTKQPVVPAQRTVDDVDLSNFIVKRESLPGSARLSEIMQLSCAGEKVTARHLGVVLTYHEESQYCAAFIETGYGES